LFDLVHDSAENIRDAKETQHLRKIKVVDKQESKPSNLHVGAKRKVVDGDYSADSAKRFKSSGPLTYVQYLTNLLSALRTLEVCLQILDATLPQLFSTPRDRKLKR
jgi:hypothetical protein